MRTVVCFLSVGLLIPTILGQMPATQPATMPAAVQQVLRYVPDDADLILLVPSLDALSHGLSGFAKAIAAEELAGLDAAGVLRASLGPAAAALNMAGPLVVVLSARRDEPLLIASVAADPGWRSATQPTQLRGGELVYDFGPDRYVAAVAGTVAILAREPGELPRALDSAGQVAARVQELRDPAADRQMLVYVNVPGWSALIDTQLARLAQAMYLPVTASGPDVEVGVQIWSWLLEQLKKLVSEAQTCVATLRVGADGVFLDIRLTFRPDGQITRYLGQVRRPGRDLLRGLRAGRIPLVVAFEWEEAEEAVGFSAAMAKAMLGMDSLRSKVGAEKLQTFIEKSIAVSRKVPGSNVALTIDPEGLVYWGLYLTPEPLAVQRELRSFSELAPELLGAWGTFPASVVSCEPEKVAGVEADVLKFDLEREPSPVQPVMQAIYGMDPRLYTAPHSEGVAYAFGPHELARQKLSELLAAGGLPLREDPRVLELRKAFSPDPQLCILVDLPALARCFITMCTRLGLPITPPPGQQDVPLAGLTFYLEPAAARAEVFVPPQPVKAMLQVIEGFRSTADRAY